MSNQTSANDKVFKRGIWKYRKFFPYVTSEKILSLKEGNTPFNSKENIYFKYEFLNPTGSVKDRSFSYQISKLFEKGIKNVVISSSGNAAISAACYCALAKISLTAFVSYRINKNKLSSLKSLSANIIQSNFPLRESVKFAKSHGFYHLRQSKDVDAVYGLKTIAFEIAEKLPDIEAVFIPVSSGTTLVGVAKGFEDLGLKVALHAVQTSKVHPIASTYDHNFIPSNKNIADAIVAKYTPRKCEIIKIINKSKGSGWVIESRDALKAEIFLRKYDIVCSFEGVLSLAAYFKAERNGFKYNKAVCILTGKKY